MLLLLLLPGILAQSYLSEPPVKLLTAKLFGNIFPAAESEFRVSTTGEDHETELSQLEEANQMPHQLLVLSPGGSAVYKLPINKDLIYLMIRPGKKEGGSGSPYSNKADIMVSAATDEGDSVSVECSVNSHDGSPAPDRYCTLDLQPLHQLRKLKTVIVTIHVPVQETRIAFLWQLHLSPLDDSERVMGTFEEDGRKLMRKTQENESTDTWLTMVSIVGNTGVGKSTVASLLSGNDTMFKVASSSSGTTTIGADISPIIPSEQYGARLEEILELGSLYNPGKLRPLFLIDSEGMSFRGDEVDFVTTGPVAIIANIIVWITTDRMRPPEILGKVDEYMKGLDRITMGDESSEEQAYGEFIIVLNKMQLDLQGSTDEQICSELMAYGPDEEDNAIRDEMYMRFKDIACIGFPTVELEEDESFGYPVLKRYPRFREGLKKLANRVLQESETALSVTVGPKTYEMNSTEAETIIGMLIDGANKGNIDLSDFCNVIGSISKEKIIQQMGKMTTEMEEATQGLCNTTEQSCTICACRYKNDAINSTVKSMNEIIINAIEEASLLCADRPDVQEDITQLMEDIVQPWASLNRCFGSITTTVSPVTTATPVTTASPATTPNESSTIGSTFPSSSPTTNPISNISTTPHQKPIPIPTQCDISTLDLNHPGQELDIICISLFLCGYSMMDAQKINISTNLIYVALNTTFQTVDMGQAQQGSNATDYGLEGGKGEDGAAAANVTINATKMLASSADSLTFRSPGQKGGEGGIGGERQPMGEICYSGPSTPEQVVSMGEQYNHRHETDKHCSITTCHTHKDYWDYKYNLSYPVQCCGGDGGKGGDGGNGGAPGILTIIGDSGIYPINLPGQGGQGGDPGLGGTGAAGYNIDRLYKAWYKEWTSTECGWVSDWFHCKYWDHSGFGGYEINPNNDKPCLGQAGPQGNRGKPWEDAA